MLKLRLITCLFIGLLYASKLDAQWQTLGTVPTSSPDISCFTYFLGAFGQPQVGYTSFRDYWHLDTLYKTTDFGKSWCSSFVSPHMGGYINDIVFKDSLNGWLCTEDTTFVFPKNGFIYATTDAGLSWHLASPLNGSFLSINYNPLSHCLIASGGANDGSLISHDDGNTFSRIVYDCFSSLFIGDSIIILFGGGANHGQARSTDRGITWKINQVSFDGGCLGAYYDAKANLVFYIGGMDINDGDRIVYVSSDKGLAWQIQYRFPFPSAPSIGATSGQVVGACGYLAVSELDQGILLSSDHGITWENIGMTGFSPIYLQLMMMDMTGLYFTDPNHVIQRFPLSNSPLVRLETPVTFVTPNGYETDIPLSLLAPTSLSRLDSLDLTVIIPSIYDKFLTVSSPGWNVVSSALDSGLFALHILRTLGDSMICMLQIIDTLSDPNQQILTVLPGVTSALAPAGCWQLTANFSQYSGCGIKILKEFMQSDKMPEFSIYPNPAGNSITIESSGNLDAAQFEIFDQLGRLVVRKENEQAVLHVSSLPNGIYYMRMDCNGFVRTKSVVINK